MSSFAPTSSPFSSYKYCPLPLIILSGSLLKKSLQEGPICFFLNAKVSLLGSWSLMMLWRRGLRSILFPYVNSWQNCSQVCWVQNAPAQLSLLSDDFHSVRITEAALWKKTTDVLSRPWPVVTCCDSAQTLSNDYISHQVQRPPYLVHMMNWTQQFPELPS